MSGSSRRRVAASEAVGALLFMLIALSAFSSYLVVLSFDNNAYRAASSAAAVVNNRIKENLAVFCNSGSVAATNNGEVDSDILYYFSISAQGIATATKINVDLKPGSTYQTSGSCGSAGIVTSYGNVFLVEQAQGPLYTLVTSTTGNGYIGPAPGTYTYPSGASLTLTASPASNFKSWSISPCASPSGQTIQGNIVTINIQLVCNVQATANFG